jgi:hypothetical protein
MLSFATSGLGGSDYVDHRPTLFSTSKPTQGFQQRQQFNRNTIESELYEIIESVIMANSIPIPPRDVSGS